MRRKRMRRFGLLAAALLLGGMAGCSKDAARKAGNGKKKETAPYPITTNSARNVYFYLLAPDKEERSGLLTCHRLRNVGWSYVAMFQLAADYKQKHGVPAPQRAGDPVSLVGRLSRTVSKYEFFQPGAVSIKGNTIKIPVKYVRYIGITYPDGMPGLARRGDISRTVYFRAKLSALPPGKYSAEVTFKNYTYQGDKSKIKRDRTRVSFQPLTCKFEVRKAEKISWGKVVNGLQAGISLRETSRGTARPAAPIPPHKHSGEPIVFRVYVRNVGTRPAKILGLSAGWRLWQPLEELTVSVAGKRRQFEGGVPHRIMRPLLQNYVNLKPGETQSAERSLVPTDWGLRPGQNAGVVFVLGPV